MGVVGDLGPDLKHNMKTQSSFSRIFGTRALVRTSGLVLGWLAYCSNSFLNGLACVFVCILFWGQGAAATSVYSGGPDPVVGFGCGC